MNFKQLTQPVVKSMCFALSLAALSLISSCQKENSSDPVTTNANLKDLNTSFGDAATTSKYKFSNPISLNGAHDITINGDSINGGSQACINLMNCNNIHITNCRLANSKTLGIQISNCTNILIDYNYITNVATGVYVVNSKTVRVNYNQMKNMQGPYPRGAFIQFDNVSGGYNRVNYNKLENIMGASNPEDAISMYKSSGLSSDPIYIAGNWIRGGGPSKTGGGIMLGDNGGNYQIAIANVLVDPGQYGMAVSGGSNMQIVNNAIYARAQSFTNVGLYYWNQSGLSSSAVTISGNKVNFTSGMYGKNNSYVGSGSATPSGWSTNTWNASINASILPATIITYK